MKNIILFDRRHTAGDIFSKHAFQIDQAMTIMAVGLHEEDEITFEILHFEAPPKDNCNCFLTVKMPTLIGVQQLVCADCDDDLEPYPVRLTLKNPVVILNVPQGAFIRARYEGPGIGASRVWAYRDTALRTDLAQAGARGNFAYIPPELRGCPPVPCVSDEWEPTGNLRCGEVDPVSAMYDVEAEYVNECDETEWREEEPRLAVDTGQKRCEESLEDDYLTEKEVITDCGKTAWVIHEVDPALKWQETGQRRCGPVDPETREYVIEVEERSLCNLTRRVEKEPPAVAAATGQIKCEESLEDDYAVWDEVVTVCGEAAWVPSDKPAEVKWQETGQRRCGPVDPETREYIIEVEERSLCNLTRWTALETLEEAEATGQIKCEESLEDDYAVWEEVVTACGESAWVPSEKPAEVKWQETGQRRCGPVDPETREYVIEVEERSLCNLTRRTELESTFEAVETGASRCQEHQLQVQVVTKCGDLAWASTEESCGWIATLPLPLECCGLAFRPEDIRDPEATVELKGCEDDSPVIGYIYPNPRPWATTPVTTCETCDDQNLIGFAVNSKTGDCKCP